MNRLSVIILAHNKERYTRACLEGLVDSQGVELDAIVIDNGSTDGTGPLLEEFAPRFEHRGASLRWRRNALNVGCSTGRNQGLEMAQGDYCAFMDNDIVVCDPLWAAKLIESLEQTDRAALIGPKLTYPFPPHWIQCAGVGISKTGRVCFLGRGGPRNAPQFNARREVQCLISACFLFHRRLYDETGGLDEAFNPIEFEDFDFCYRARAAGHRCIYEPAVELHHWESITSEGTPVLPNTYLIIKHGLLFKQRWAHVFEKEEGPPDEQCVWKKITMPSLDGKRTV